MLIKTALQILLVSFLIYVYVNVYVYNETLPWLRVSRFISTSRPESRRIYYTIMTKSNKNAFSFDVALFDYIPGVKTSSAKTTFPFSSNPNSNLVSAMMIPLLNANALAFKIEIIFTFGIRKILRHIMHQPFHIV